ncbi:hypothetical protein [Rhodococcus sp. ARC_M6]|uniref:hypothetical protein n=1 Tax=Rhodococcus sp. ARC_M6 TaxID=2928852 RepID=UPI001FB1D604|nr:hypothetical protein [Rhodococcus sp. ARC_M6]MCJ0902527.1 hypothetical protein [Rhodococcus sp. ARC_M6]
MSVEDPFRRSAEIADAVRAWYPRRITRLQSNIKRVVSVELKTNDRTDPGDRLGGPAFDTRDTRVCVGHSFRPYVTDLGSFPAGVAPQFVRLGVSVTRSAADAGITISYEEAEGWFRAALGVEWSDYAYQYGATTDFRSPASYFSFGVIIDRTGRPLLTPDNFDWTRIDGEGTVARKIVPDPANVGLIEQLDRIGPCIDTSAYRDPRITPDGRWVLAVTTANPDPSSIRAFDALVDRLRVRGLIDTRFVPHAVHLAGSTAVVEFRRVGVDRNFRESVPVPTEEDLRIRPESGEWVLQLGYRPSVFPQEPDQWALGLCAHWTEMFAYGPLGKIAE